MVKEEARPLFVLPSTSPLNLVIERVLVSMEEAYSTSMASPRSKGVLNTLGLEEIEAERDSVLTRERRMLARLRAILYLSERVGRLDWSCGGELGWGVGWGGVGVVG